MTFLETGRAASPILGSIVDSSQVTGKWRAGDNYWGKLNSLEGPGAYRANTYQKKEEWFCRLPSKMKNRTDFSLPRSQSCIGFVFVRLICCGGTDSSDRVNISAPDVVSHSSCPYIRHMAEIIHCVGPSLDWPFSSILPSEFRQFGNTSSAHSYPNYLRNCTAVSEKWLSLNHLSVLSCHTTPTLTSISLFSSQWMGLSLNLFSKFHCLCFFLFRTYFLVSKTGLYSITLLFLFQFLHYFFILS